MEELEDVYRLRYELAGADETIKALRGELEEVNEKLEELIKSVSTCTSKLPDGVAFDIANDDIRYQIVCNLIDRNGEHRKIIKDLKSKLAESESELKEYHDWLDQYHLNPYQIHLYITGLKVQLAEKDKELNDICQNYDFQINDFSREIHRLQEREKVLEQQLAEKDKQILELQEQSIRDNQIYNEELVEKKKEIEEKNNVISALRVKKQ